ncbi:hypothetical protein L6452_34971 [Arctium lappa]|uniref:Uncharacterized protein n=1 Tax=Arctium lappa TaxID=4217 RepID=A0ACB8YK73_ARCLA|nr:hypothetical protein L6452_34971 [Arctium lappa]
MRKQGWTKAIRQQQAAGEFFPGFGRCWLFGISPVVLAMASESDVVTKQNLSGNGVHVTPSRAEVMDDGSKGMHANAESRTARGKEVHVEGNGSVSKDLVNVDASKPAGTGGVEETQSVVQDSEQITTDGSLMQNLRPIVNRLDPVANSKLGTPIRGKEPTRGQLTPRFQMGRSQFEAL